MDKKSKTGKKKQKTVPEVGVAHIRATFNNTISPFRICLVM
ncbi:MAG: hypothetical protein Ct9H300mP23_08510 [Nitrospinota bacterium]|nr:MAG: hypothetical protein Ct9H300mP23_08510 [Nitrospinota bacterium]